MSKLLAFLMLFPFTLIIIFQPYLDRVEEKRSQIVQIALQRGLEKAAIEGRFTNDTIDEMVEMLENVGYERDEIEFQGTTQLTYRNNYVEGALRVPNQLQMLLLENYLDGEVSEKYHASYGTRMSEYID